MAMMMLMLMLIVAFCSGPDTANRDSIQVHFGRKRDEALDYHALWFHEMLRHELSNATQVGPSSSFAM
jgi:hypothetical protein